MEAILVCTLSILTVTLFKSYQENMVLNARLGSARAQRLWVVLFVDGLLHKLEKSMYREGTNMANDEHL
ncbi:hypothetical protein OF83DRAFT_1174879 [Amylostereum chailletii]|nr:hypothetical protein OF83DRAFT_1174879 [Amylostereum chailletii]